MEGKALHPQMCICHLQQARTIGNGSFCYTEQKQAEGVVGEGSSGVQLSTPDTYKGTR